MTPQERRMFCSELHDILTRVRDFATSLLGDPAQGDRVVRRAKRRILRSDPERTLRGVELEDALNECVVELCAEAYFPGSAERLAYWHTDDCGEDDNDAGDPEDPGPQDDPDPCLPSIVTDEERRGVTSDTDEDERHPFKEAA
jgi:hypothetical protein